MAAGRRRQSSPPRGPRPRGIRGEQIARRAPSAGSVSYTHLDVYKRQPPGLSPTLWSCANEMDGHRTIARLPALAGHPLAILANRRQADAH